MRRIRLWAIGASLKTEPVEILEELSRKVTASGIDRLFGAASSAVGLLSTCNRVELYLATDEPPSAHRMVDWFIEANQRRKEGIYVFEGGEAVRHLMLVACGLDSMVAGEAQIQLQVKHAPILGGEGRARKAVERLFRSAYFTASTVRKEVALSAKPTVGLVAVRAIKSKLSTRAKVILIGAGKNAKAAAEALSDEGFSDLYLVNRTPEKVKPLAVTEGSIHPLQELPALLNVADAVIVATSSPYYLITSDMLKQRPRKDKLIIVDTSLPRNVEPSLKDHPSVELLDLDDLAAYVTESISQEQREKAEEIVNGATTRFTSWMLESEVEPVVSWIRARAEEIRREEALQALRRLTGDRRRDELVIGALTSRIVNRLLQTPIDRLRSLADEGLAEPYEKMLKELFGADG